MKKLLKSLVFMMIIFNILLFYCLINDTFGKSEISYVVPASTPVIQESIISLQQCEELNKAIPNAKFILATNLPVFAYGILEDPYCARYYSIYKNFKPTVIINLSRSDGCGSLKTLFRHELLHHLGIHHPSDDALLYTEYDDVHVMLQKCFGENYLDENT